MTLEQEDQLEAERVAVDRDRILRIRLGDETDPIRRQLWADVVRHYMIAEPMPSPASIADDVIQAYDARFGNKTVTNAPINRPFAPD